MTGAQSNHQGQKHHHGFWLTAFLVIVVLHGLSNILLVRDSIQQQYEQAIPWVLPALFILALLDIVAAYGIWKWKKWGLVLYGISTLGMIAAGLALTGAMMLVFFYLIPVGILATIIGTRWKFFT